MSLPTMPSPGRDVHYFTHPTHWPSWPFLPVVRRHGNGQQELGILVDACGSLGLTGYSATVFLTNLFALPPTLPGLLALPKEVFDTAEEMAQAGWRVD